MTVSRARAFAWLAALVVIAGVGSWALGNGERAGGGDDVDAGGEASVASGGEAATVSDSCHPDFPIRGLLGEGSEKIRREDGKVFVWAGGAESGPAAEWFDFTGAPFPAESLQYGIGKDRIRSIDDPVFVQPDDPRLMEIPPSRYRPCERPRTPGEIRVIGYVSRGVARAYPVALLDHHEVVNDRIRGKPFTVGW